MRRTWVVACDASRGRVFEIHRNRRDWKLVHQLENPAGRAKGHVLTTDRPGRVAQSAGSFRAAMAPTTSPHEVEAERFAHSIAKLLEAGLDANAYQRLCLIAPPHFLGLLRSALNANVSKHVELSLDKDYTELEASELAERLEL